MRFKYTADQIDFLTREFKTLALPDLVIAFNKKFNVEKTANQIKSTISNHKIRCGRKVGLAKGYSRLFTKSQMEYIAEKYQLHKAARVASLLNKTCNGSFTEQQIKNFVHNHGINCPRTGHFKKGKTPWNAGTKGVMQANSGCFQKGEMPINHKPVGSERINQDGYREIKVAEPRTWALLQRHNWAKAYGTENMPEILRFKDGNKQNCDVDNLEPVSNQEHMLLNNMGFNQLPNDVKPVALTIAKIDAKTYNLNKRLHA